MRFQPVRVPLCDPIAHSMDRTPRTLMVNESGDGLTGDFPHAHSFGIALHEGTVPMYPQAVEGLLTQALYKAFLQLGTQPLLYTKLFQHNYAEAMTARICYNVDLEVTSEPARPGPFGMTNKRIALVLSLMGFDFSHQNDLNQLREYTFDILVETQENRTVIGHGSIKNSQPLLRPSLVGGHLVSPLCPESASTAVSRKREIRRWWPSL